MSCPGSYHNSTQGGSLRALEVGRCHPTPQSVRKLPPGGKVTQARVRNTLMVRQAMPWQAVGKKRRTHYFTVHICRPDLHTNLGTSM